MRAASFTKWLGKVSVLSKGQRAQLLEGLQPAVGLDRGCDAIGGDARQPPCCPGCKSSSSYRHGRTRGLQRYRCRSCGKTFTALT